MVLAGYIVEHKELVSVAEPLLPDLPSVPWPEEPKSVYTGGDYRCQGESGVCIISSSSYLFSLFFFMKFDN